MSSFRANLESEAMFESAQSTSFWIRGLLISSISLNASSTPLDNKSRVISEFEELNKLAMTLSEH